MKLIFSFVFELPVRVIYSLQLVGDLIDGFGLNRNNDPLSIGYFMKLLGEKKLSIDYSQYDR